jgi:hypothetical protein
MNKETNVFQLMFQAGVFKKCFALIFQLSDSSQCSKPMFLASFSRLCFNSKSPANVLSIAYALRVKVLPRWAKK